MTWVVLVRVGAALAFLPMLMGSEVTPPAEVASPAAVTGFQVYHYGSLVEGIAFREVFIVHDVSAGWSARTAQLEIRVNGEPLSVAWEDADGLLSIDDQFWFVQEAFDQKQVLTGHHQGRQVMECRFGGGAGLSIHPDEWREMGMPEQVRCLHLVDDQ